MPEVEVLETGLVYRNPKPHLRSVHAYFPSVVVLSKDEFLASMVLGSAFESIDCHIYLARSTDSGRTWNLEGPLYGGDPNRPTSETCRISIVPGGEVVAFGARFDRSNTEEGLTNPETLGFVPTELFLFRSGDGGRTWSGPEFVDPPLVGPSFEICAPVLPLEDGRWLAPTSTWRGWDGECPNGMKAIALVSYDRGRTWPEYVDVMDGRERGIIYWEQKIIKLEGSRLLSVAWAFHEPSGEDLPNAYSISEDCGRSFGPVRSTGVKGQTLTPLYLGDGLVLSAYRRTDRPGLWAVLSLLEGDGWRNISEAPIWGAGMEGLRREGPTEDMSREFRSLKFGAPSLVQLPDGDIFLAFWCVEDCVSNIRWFRLRVR